jgi:hypothetical protein
MKHRKIVFSIALLALACSAASWAQTTPSSGAAQPQAVQDESKYTAGGQLRKPSKYSDLPAKGEFADTQTQTEPPEDQARRKVREAHFTANNSVLPALFPTITDPGKSVDGQTETGGIKFYDYAGVISTLPARTSAAVVIGTVVSGKAFLTKDRTYVYSDYQVRIDEILKPDAAASLIVGGQLIAFRPGGTLHFPSGHVRHFLDAGQGYPIVGAQYLFFLGRPDSSIAEYEMTSFAAYQLLHGLVYPLDDANNSQFEGLSQTVLLGRVKQLIAASQNGGLE